MEAFSRDYPHVRVQLHESVLNGGVEMLYDGSADLIISGLAAQAFWVSRWSRCVSSLWRIPSTPCTSWSVCWICVTWSSIANWW